MQKTTLIFATFALLWLPAAYGYIGPGVGAGTLAIVMGVLSSIFFAFVGILWYPIKRLIKGTRVGVRRALQRRQESPDAHPGSR